MATLYAGTSGFAYASWKPDFYPAGLPTKKFLEYYSTRLNAVEVNYTFRRLPSPATLAGWVETTPQEFVFGLKGHMRITHIERLRGVEFENAFFHAIDPLRIKGRLGPVLFQLPPAAQADVETLAAFLERIPSGIRCAFEFRHPSWLTDEVYAALARHNASLCLAESEKLVIPKIITADFVYSRLRKPDYSVEEREEIAARVQDLVRDGRDAYVFFKHEESPAGALYAEELLRRLRPVKA